MAGYQLQDDINTLHETLLDSRNGYQECAENVNDPLLQRKFQDLSAKRQSMISELEGAAHSLGEATSEKGSTVAAAHRVFIDMKSYFTGGDKDRIIEEIERGENYLINRYQDILKHPLPNPLHEVLQKQAREVKIDLANVKGFYSA